MSQKNNNELPKQAAENTLNLNPVIGIRGKDLLTSARMVLLRRCAAAQRQARGAFQPGAEERPARPVGATPRR